MRTGNGMKALGIFLLGVLVLGAAVAWRGQRGAEPREIVLVARAMTFVDESDPARPNPGLVVRRGERVRLVIVNRDPGSRHNLSIEELGLRSRTLVAGESDAVEFTAPSRRTMLAYSCSFHAQMMRGAIVVE